MPTEYESLLKKAYKNLPKQEKATERFEIPKATGHVEGNKTIITNFKAICAVLRRDVQHLINYLQRELATPAILQDTRLILSRKISSTLINEKIQRYVNEFVLCSECKKPDTQLMKEDRITQLKCMACGAKHPIRTKI